MSDEERYYNSRSKAESQVAAGICFLACAALVAVAGVVSAAQAVIGWVV